MNKSIQFESLASQISRRDFLRLCGLGFLGLTLPEKAVENFISKISDDRQEVQLGRVAKPGQKLFEEPDLESKVIKEIPVDSILKIKDVIIGGGDSSPNQVWFEVEDQGFVHSMYVQPVADKENQPGAIILGDGCLGEVTVPFVDSYRKMDVKSTFVYRLYYASTYWILSREEDDHGTVWYQLLDDRNYSTLSLIHI